MIRPSITQEIMDRLEKLEITSANLVDIQDGEGIPYWNEPDGVYTPSTDGEDDIEQARR
jgi:hypothetical protein